jgi:CheY-like chemotaxis protein
VLFFRRQRFGKSSLELPIILVVEDDHLIQGLVEEALRDGGFDTAVTASAEEALTLLQGPAAQVDHPLAKHVSIHAPVKEATEVVDDR